MFSIAVRSSLACFIALGLLGFAVNVAEAQFPTLPPRLYYCLPEFTEISKVDGVEQSFFIDLQMTCYYQEFYLNLSAVVNSPSDYIPLDETQLAVLRANSLLFDPIFTNKISIVSDGQKYYGILTAPTVILAANVTVYPGIQWIAFSSRYSGQFKAKLGLQDFPFDKQTLFVNVSNFLPVKYCQFVPSWKADFRMLGQVDQVIGWEVESVSEMAGSRYVASLDDTLPTMSYAVVLRRDPQFYVNKIIIGVVLLTIMNNFLFFMNVHDPDRLTGSITAFLGIVTYLFVLSSDVPKVAYSTRMDQFVNVSFYTVFSVFVINNIIYGFVRKAEKMIHNAKKQAEESYWPPTVLTPHHAGAAQPSTTNSVSEASATGLWHTLLDWQYTVDVILFVIASLAYGVAAFLTLYTT